MTVADGKPLTLEQATAALDALRAIVRDLRGEATRVEGDRRFSVDADESDPHEAGPLDVRISARGLDIRFSGDDAGGVWRCSWKELRHMIRFEPEMDREIALQVAERETLQTLIREARCQVMPFRRPAPCGFTPCDELRIGPTDTGTPIDIDQWAWRKPR